MLVSAVSDPSVFDASYFDEVYRIQAELFLDGIERNGLLIVDSEKRIQDAIIARITSLPIKYRQKLRIKIEELFLKKKTKRIIAITTSSNDTSPNNHLELAYKLKADPNINADGLIVSEDSLKTLKSEKRYDKEIVPLLDYCDSNFEANRQRYENKVGPIDTLPKIEVDDLIIRSVRFTKWLRFYDPQIGKGITTSRFRKGIDYILSLWKDHGYFASQQGIGDVKIYTCSAERIKDDEEDHAKLNKLKMNQDTYRKIIRELIEPLKNKFPWPIEIVVKNDPDVDFHARFLESQHAVINIERGFDLFKQNGGFKRNFISLFMAASDHIKECRELPEANISGVP